MLWHVGVIFYNIHLFIWLHGSISCGMQDLKLLHVGCRSLTRERTCAPYIGSSVLATGSPGKFSFGHFNNFFFFCNLSPFCLQ